MQNERLTSFRKNIGLFYYQKITGLLIRQGLSTFSMPRICQVLFLNKETIKMKNSVTGYNDQDVDVDHLPSYRSNSFCKNRINTSGDGCDSDPTQRRVYKLQKGEEEEYAGSHRERAWPFILEVGFPVHSNVGFKLSLIQGLSCTTVVLEQKSLNNQYERKIV